jgi:hypothetical protein
MVELRGFPIRLRVTVLAACAAAAPMHVIRHVARDALPRGSFVMLACVT